MFSGLLDDQEERESRECCFRFSTACLVPKCVGLHCSAGTSQRQRQEPLAIVLKKSSIQGVVITWEGSWAENVSAWGKRLGGDQKGVPVDVAASSGKVNTSWAIRSWNCVCKPVARKQVNKPREEQKPLGRYYAAGATGLARAWFPQFYRFPLTPGMMGAERSCTISNT